jgi:hypothetical protein
MVVLMKSFAPRQGASLGRYLTVPPLGRDKYQLRNGNLDFESLPPSTQDQLANPPPSSGPHA